MNPWERRLWSSRRYILTDFRIVSPAHELALDDVGDVQRTQSAAQRIFGLSTIAIHSKHRRQEPLVLRHVRRGAQLAALIELLASDPRARVNGAARETMAWEPHVATPGKREALTGIALVIVAVGAVIA